MAIFKYRGRDRQANPKKGIVEAASIVQASEILHGHGLTVLSLEPEVKYFNFEKYLPFLGRISQKEKVIFSRQLATLINAKVPIIQALEILHDQVRSRKLRDVIDEIIEDIAGGKSLSEAVSRFPIFFSSLYTSLIKAAELSGTVDEALTFLADQQEKDYDLRSKIKGAMIYPIFIVSAIIVVGTMMFVFVLPQMIGVLKEANVALPLTTRVLVFATNAVNKFWPLLLILVLGGTVGFQVYIRSSGGRLVWDAFKSKMPIFGKLLQNIYMTRFSRNLATLIAGGIPIVTALRTVSAVVGNSIYKEIINSAASEVQSGHPMAAAFAARPEIPIVVTQMIKIGQESGSLHDILDKLARFYEKEVENMLGQLTTLLEPTIMILLGVVVAVMVAGILLPIYNLGSAL